MANLMRNRTCITIAHRLAPAIKADRIVIMENGNQLAIGTHAELVVSNSLYARFADRCASSRETVLNQVTASRAQ